MLPEDVTSNETLTDDLDRILQPTAELADQVAFLESLDPVSVSAVDLAAMASLLRARCHRVTRLPANIIDVCGTGGDHSGSFNISTTTALVVAAAGLPVVKHGNRAVTSHCGSTDVLEHLGINPVLQPQRVREVLRRVGIAFLPAPAFHPAVAAVMPARRLLAERGQLTIFNVLGPLANPAVLHAQAVGVYCAALVEPVADALRHLGLSRALVYHGDGMDEATLTGVTHCALLDAGQINTFTLEPEEVGLTRCTRSDLAGGSPAENAEIIRSVLYGRALGPKRDIIVFNAGLTLALGGAANNFVQGCQLAERTIDSGAAARLVDGAVRVNHV